MTLDEALITAQEASSLMKSSMSTKQIDGELSHRVIASYVMIALHHHESIIKLINAHPISASALIRPLFEALIRATWLSVMENSKAVKTTLHQFAKGLDKDRGNDTFPGLWKMSKDIDTELDKGQEKSVKVFSGVIKRNLDIYHSLTHGGVQMVSRCINEDAIGPNFTDEEKAKILQGCSVHALMTVLAFAHKTFDKDLADSMNAEIIKF